MSGHTISLSTTGTVVVASQSVTGPYLNLTGTLTGNVTLDFGPGQSWWLVSAATLALGGHVLTFGSGSGTVTPIAVGQVYVVTCFGSNTIATSAAVGSSVTVAAGTGISVSGGPAYTVTNTVALPTLTNHDIVLGQGTTAPAFLAPGTSGNAAVSNGTDFVSQAIPTSIVAGTGISVSGATGAVTVTNTQTLPTLTSNDILVGQGTTTPAFLAPGPLNSGVISTGTVWQAQSIPTSILAGTGISLSGSVGAVTVTNTTASATLVANSGVALTTAATFFTAATITDTATGTQNYLCTASVRIAGPDTDQFTFGIAVNSTTVTTLRSGVVVSAGTYAGGIVDIASGTVIARTSVSGTNTFNLLVKSLNTATGFCNADFSCVRTN
jgi:hypothetical protein